MKPIVYGCAGTCLAAIGMSSVSAETVTFTAVTSSSCTLSLSNNGSLGPSSDGTVLGSEETGGTSASLTVIAVGTAPTIRVAAPSLSTPAGDSGSTGQVKYSSTAGANQDYTASETTATTGDLLDTFTIDGRIQNSGGFKAGTYSISTVVTCEQ